MIDTTVTSRNEIVRKKADRNKNKIPTSVEQLITLGISDMLKKYGSRLSTEKASLHGARDFAALKPYKSQFSALRKFFAIIGDYRSLSVIWDYPSEPFCPSMDPKSIALFIYWKRGKAGDILTDWDEHQVLDAHKRPILIEGGWNDPKALDRLSAAITLAHETRGFK